MRLDLRPHEKTALLFSAAAPLHRRPPFSGLARGTASGLSTSYWPLSGLVRLPPTALLGRIIIASPDLQPLTPSGYFPYPSGEYRHPAPLVLYEEHCHRFVVYK